MKYVPLIMLFMAMQLPTIGQETESSMEGDVANANQDSPFVIVNDAKGQPYFPKGKESYFTPYYKAAGLPSLQSKKVAKGEVIFRAAVFPSFTKKLILTYTRTNNGGMISVVRLSGISADKPGNVELSGQVAISEEAANRFEKLATWDIVRDPFKKLDDRLLPIYEGLDGVAWVLEVVDAKGYTMVDVQNPESFEYTEKQVREYYDKEIRKNPSKYGLPDEFKDQDLPDLDVSVLTSLLEDLLKIAGVGIPETRGDEIPSHVGPESK